MVFALIRSLRLFCMKRQKKSQVISRRQALLKHVVEALMDIAITCVYDIKYLHFKYLLKHCGFKKIYRLTFSIDKKTPIQLK